MAQVQYLLDYFKHAYSNVCFANSLGLGLQIMCLESRIPADEGNRQSIIDYKNDDNILNVGGSIQKL